MKTLLICGVILLFSLPSFGSQLGDKGWDKIKTKTTQPRVVPNAVVNYGDKKVEVYGTGGTSIESLGVSVTSVSESPLTWDGKFILLLFYSRLEIKQLNETTYSTTLYAKEDLINVDVEFPKEALELMRTIPTYVGIDKLFVYGYVKVTYKKAPIRVKVILL